MGVNTCFVELLNVIMGVTNERGRVDGYEKIGGDEIKDVLGQM